MSSYQFVNSMSACYGRVQDVSAVAADYYGAAMNSYDTCYSPPLQQYGAYTPTGTTPLPNGTQAADFLASASVAAATATGSLGTGDDSGSSTPGPSVHPRLHQSSSPATTPQTNSTTVSSNNTSCKFAPTPESGTNAVGSPQDLSVSAGGPASSGSASGSEQNTPTSGAGGGTGNGGNSGSGTGGGSEAGEGSEAGDSTAGGSGSLTKSNPQIYPWMKRVHLGTNSKYYNITSACYYLKRCTISTCHR